MEPPAITHNEAIRDEVVKVFRQIRPLLPADIVRGQFQGYWQDAVECAWSVVDGILGDVTPVHDYETGSWGPAEVNTLTADVGGWIQAGASS
jgi:glucose-6-phosphate 1-dehydrogenase